MYVFLLIELTNPNAWSRHLPIETAIFFDHTFQTGSHVTFRMHASGAQYIYAYNYTRKSAVAAKV